MSTAYPHQAILPLPVVPRLRSCRRPFSPTEPAGPYKLPRPVLDCLTVRLRVFRNRDAAFALAVFLGRYWSAPKRLGLPFPIDRRALTDHAALALTEAQIRGAIGTLEAVGFLDRAETRRRYQATANGLHRRPILFSFGLEVLTAFETANRMAQARAQEAGGRRRVLSRGGIPAPAPRPSCPALTGLQSSSPKNTSSLERGVIMGDHKKSLAEGRTAPPAEPNPSLEDALTRLLAGASGTWGG